MIPVKQTIVDKDHGDCTRACIASLLELELKEVPNFCESGDDAEAWRRTRNFLEERGLFISTITQGLLEMINQSNGIDGHFVCSVESINMPDTSHAVIFKKQANDVPVFVHDPSPGKKKNWTWEDVTNFDLIEPLAEAKKRFSWL